MNSNRDSLCFNEQDTAFYGAQFIGPIRGVHQSGCPLAPVPALPHQKEGAWNWASGCEKAEGLWLNLPADTSDLAPWISKQFWQWDAWKLITPFCDPSHSHTFTHMQCVSLPLWGVGSVYIRLITGQSVAECVHTHADNVWVNVTCRPTHFHFHQCLGHTLREGGEI